MKTVGEALSKYLNTERHITSCDLYELAMHNGHSYYYADIDRDISFGGALYLHNALILQRQQIKMDSSIVVDSMTVTAYMDRSDQVEAEMFMKAAHSGVLDKSKLYLRRCFFNEGNVVGVISLGGNVEVKSAGGIKMQLTVKAKTQGLNMPFPIRKYYPQGSYTTNADSNVISETQDETTCLIAPYVPLKETLL